MRVVIIVQTEPDLLQIVDALNAPGRLAGGLHGRQQKTDENGDNCDDHQQLDGVKPRRRTIMGNLRGINDESKCSNESIEMDQIGQSR